MKKHYFLGENQGVKEGTFLFNILLVVIATNEGVGIVYVTFIFYNNGEKLRYYCN